MKNFRKPHDVDFLARITAAGTVELRSLDAKVIRLLNLVKFVKLFLLW